MRFHPDLQSGNYRHQIEKLPNYSYGYGHLLFSLDRKEHLNLWEFQSKLQWYYSQQLGK
jgi:hypothetical protein